MRPKTKTCAASHLRGPTCYPHCQCLLFIQGLDRAHALLGHVARDLKDHDAHEHQLVAHVDRRLSDLDVLEEATGQCTSEVHAI